MAMQITTSPRGARPDPPPRRHKVAMMCGCGYWVRVSGGDQDHLSRLITEAQGALGHHWGEQTDLTACLRDRNPHGGVA